MANFVTTNSQCNVNQHDSAFNVYPFKAPHFQLICNLINGVRMRLMDDHPPRLFNNDPPFSVSEQIGIAQQLRKWLKT